MKVECTCEAIYNPITDSQIKDDRQTQSRQTRELLNKTIQYVFRPHPAFNPSIDPSWRTFELL